MNQGKVMLSLECIMDVQIVLTLIHFYFRLQYRFLLNLSSKNQFSENNVGHNGTLFIVVNLRKIK